MTKGSTKRIINRILKNDNVLVGDCRIIHHSIAVGEVKRESTR
jgi:hypothetical protein